MVRIIAAHCKLRLIPEEIADDIGFELASDYVSALIAGDGNPAKILSKWKEEVL